jgi:hypothetical protein
VNLRVNDRFFRLSDIATITRGYVDPPQPMFRFKRRARDRIAIGMKANGNILQFGKDLRVRMREIVATPADRRRRASRCPNQPAVVEEAVGGFTKALFEAVVIVLVVSFLSLGLRAGLVVAIAIPAGAGRHLRLHGVFRHHPAAHLARRADHRAWPAGRRRHDLGRDDGGAAARRATRWRRPRPSPTARPPFPC